MILNYFKRDGITMKSLLVSLLVFTPALCFTLNINPICNPEDILVDTVFVDGVEYHLLSLSDFPHMINGTSEAGSPSLPYITRTFLLPPDTEISSLTITNTKWTALPGKYYLYPAQSGLMGDSTFTPPDSALYSMQTPFPGEPVCYSTQGSAMGYSVSTVSGLPVRYTPSDSLVEVLTRMRVSFSLIPSVHERVVPVRETELCAEIRHMNIRGLVANSELLSLYDMSEVNDRGLDYTGLDVFDAPSPEGDGVDMIIITSGTELVEAFSELAEYRTSQGIITVIRTVEWIETTYSGCDTPERIRNFIRDSHENWGAQAVILGGDDSIVPTRYLGGNSLGYYYPADDYYADIDGDWAYDGENWTIEGTSAYIDLMVGRIPADNSIDVATMTAKIVSYETEPDNSSGFCRKLTLMGSEAVSGFLVSDCQAIVTSLQLCGAIPSYLSTPLELYWSSSIHSLTRENVLQAFDSGCNFSVHCDHSSIHQLGAGEEDPHRTIGDYDFTSMGNQNKTGILWTVGCWVGYFAEAECFAEAALLTDDETGFVAVMASSTVESGFNWKWSLSFIDALYSTGWTQWGLQMPVNWPVSYLGQAFRHQKNFKPLPASTYLDQRSARHHLFGDPFTFVWRDDPIPLDVSCSPSSGVTTGTQTFTVTVTKTSGMIQIPVADATVCIWNAEGNDVFALGRTDSNGDVVFSNLEISQPGDLSVTATKRRLGTDVAAFIPDTETITVSPAVDALVCLDSAAIDDDNSGSSQGSGDGVVNPGETIELYVTAGNTGGSSARNVFAELTVVSGASFISVSSDRTSFQDIPPTETRQCNSPFVFTLSENLESYSAVELEIEFSYNLTESWTSPYSFSILSEAYSIPLISDISHTTTSTQVTIDLTDFLVVNTGIGDGLDLEMTVSSISPSEPFTCNTLSNLGPLSPTDCAEVSGQLSLEITPDNPSTSPWTNPLALGASFEIEVSSAGGEFIGKTLSFDAIRSPGTFGTIGSLDITEASQSSLELNWNPVSSPGNLVGYYLYYGESGGPLVRSTPLPIPVAHGFLDNLEPLTEYIVDVKAVDAIGRQSNPGSNSFFTTCETVSGWPIQLDGATGTGPVIVNMDSDSPKEIVAASSFGNVYIIESDGQMETIPPPSNFSFDRYVSLAVGDLDNDSDNEIIVSCQQDICDGDASLLLYDRTAQGTWTGEVLDSFGPDETVCGAEATGTPVLLQANSSQTLEIALRTKGASSSLHIWYWNSGLSDWCEMTGSPIALSGSFFAEPIAVDFDDDGYDELIVTQLSNGYSALHVVDFYSGGFTESDIQLTELGVDGRVYSTLAAAEYDGEVFIIGVARYNNGNGNKLFAYNITTNQMEWYTTMLLGADSDANMGGPAIGYANTDAIPDVFYMTAFNMTAWQLTDGSQVSSGSALSGNSHGEYDFHARSATIAAGAISAYSDVTIPHIGFSTNYYALDLAGNLQPYDGFPVWTETASWTAPVVGDTNADGLFELLIANQSGELSLYNWGAYSTSQCWPVYQHDTHRTGYFDSGRASEGFDIELLHIETASVSGSARECYRVLLGISGCEMRQGDQRCTEIINTVDPSQSSISHSRNANHGLNLSRPEASRTRMQSQNADDLASTALFADVALISHGAVIATGTVPIVNGQQELILSPSDNLRSDCTIVVDPENRFNETDETNNSGTILCSPIETTSGISISVENPCESLAVTMVLPEGDSAGFLCSVYSIDGRLHHQVHTEALSPGVHSIDLAQNGVSNGLPAGVYLVHIEGMSNGIAHVRKVVVL